MEQTISDERAMEKTTTPPMTPPTASTTPANGHALTSVANLSLAEFECLLRRVVREVVREELAHGQAPPLSILDDWNHEGPDDPEGDAKALAEALETWEEYKDKPETWFSLDDIEDDPTEIETQHVVYA